MKTVKQPWLNTAWSDWTFILSPPFFCLALIVLFPSQFQQSTGIPIAYWVLLVVFIDVAHVYSTLYRTYFNAENFRKNYNLLLAVPLCCYVAGVIIYQLSDTWFWRILAYLAVYHFIRQQYGFMNLYRRFENVSRLEKSIDTLTIYSATIYPLIFWHLSGDRNFNWFIAGDFFSYKHNILLTISGILYLVVLCAYLIKEALISIREGTFNIPKNVLIVGTVLSWYFGIVYFNGDMAFTLLNVVSHGIPYMALIWFFEKRKHNALATRRNLSKLAFGKYGLVYFLFIILAFAYLEEGLWDALVWNEHRTFFKPFSILPILDNAFLLGFAIPLLTVPQVTHYVLDGFIWKKKNGY